MLAEIRLSEVPLYLQDSSLYKEFQNNKVEDEILYIPEMNMKLSEDFNDSIELHHLLSTLRYWGVKTIPIDVFDIVNCGDHNYKQVIAEFHSEYLYMTSLNPPASQNQIIINNAMKTGCIEIVKYLHIQKNVQFDQNSCEYAAGGGHLDCLQYAMKMKAEINENVLISAASGGHLKCLQYLLQKGYVAIKSIAAAAARKGHIEILEYLQEKGLRFTNEDCIAAAESGSIKCLVYTHTNGGSIDQAVGIMAVYSGNIQCLYYTLQNGTKLTTNLTTSAARCGHLNLLKYLHTCHCPWNETSCAEAARYGHLEILQYLHIHGCIWNNSTCLNAAYTGKLDCLQYAHQHNCPWDDRTTLNAAIEQHFDCLIYAIQNKCPIQYKIILICEKHSLFNILIEIVRIDSKWNHSIYEIFMKHKYIDGLLYMYENTTYKCDKIDIYAAEIGKLDILKYIATKYYYINYKEISLICIQYGQLECLKWSFRPTKNKKIKLEYLIQTAKYGHINILQYFIEENNFEYNLNIINIIIKNNHYHCLEYIYNYNLINKKEIILWDLNTCIIAAENGHIKCLKFLFEHNCIRDRRVYYGAIVSSNQECIQYCLDNNCTQYTPIIEVVHDQIDNESICACTLS